MSSVDTDRPRDALLYSEKLLGLRDDCNIPYCRQWESSTGWLSYNVEVELWFIEFECPSHGRGGTWKPEWQPLIDEVIGIKVREGVDVSGALQALREGKSKR